MNPEEAATAAFVTGLLAGSLTRADLPVKIEVWQPEYRPDETVMPILFPATGNQYEVVVRPRTPTPTANELENPELH